MCFAKRVSKPVVRTGAHPLRCLRPLFTRLKLHVSPVLFGLVLFGLVFLCLVFFGYRALAELDGPLCLGQRVHDAQVRILDQLF